MRMLVCLPMLVAFAAGCGVDTLEYVPLNAPPRPPTRLDPTQVRLYFGEMPRQPYVSVGMLRVESSDATLGELVGRLRRAAADNGCDGLLLEAPGSGTAVDPGLAGANILAALGGAHVDPDDSTVPIDDLSAACIVSETPAGVGPPPPPALRTPISSDQARSEAVAAEAAREEHAQSQPPPVGAQ